MDSCDLNKLVIIVTTTIILAGILALTILGGIAFFRAKKGAAKSFTLLLRRSDFLRIGTVIMIIVAVIYCSAIDKLTDGVIAILSGIAGYVLGGLSKKNVDIKDEEED